MPITTSAKKALRGSRRKREVNLARKKVLTQTVKTFRKLLSDKKAKEAREYFSQVQQALDKAVKTGLLKANTVARKKSRFVAAIKKLG